MSDQDATYRVEDGVAIVTLNRPDKLNAWTGDMDEAVYAHMQAASADDDVRIIVLTGAGRGFCAGADMENLQRLQAGGSSGSQSMQAEQIDRRINRDAPADFGGRYNYFPAVPKPVIGAINGVTAGLGMVIALHCDYRIWSQSARMSTVFAKRGLIAEWGIAWILQRLIGPARSAELLFSARFVQAEEAMQIGLANQVLPDEGFQDAVLAHARELAHSVSPRSQRVMKHQLWHDMFSSLSESVALGSREMVASFDSEDFREGLAHFVEKRAPRFSGR